MDDVKQFQNLFLQSAGEHVERLNTLLNAEQNHETISNIDDLHLHAHSLKGEALAMQYPQFGAYITVIEKYLKSLKDNNISIPQDKNGILKECVNELYIGLQYIKAEKTDPLDFENKTQHLKKVLGVSL